MGNRPLEEVQIEIANSKRVHDTGISRKKEKEKKNVERKWGNFPLVVRIWYV